MCKTEPNQKYETKQEVKDSHNVGERLSMSNGNSPNDDHVVDLEHGDPTMYYPYWKKVEDECSVTIKASELMSYFANNNDKNNLYQMPDFTDAVRRVHRVVGNAVTEGRYIVGGTGSSQLFLVALRTLASSLNATADNNNKIPVLCAEPYYSCYKEAVDEENSEIFQWGGDAYKFEEEGPFIEVVTSPNNPDGSCRKPMINREGGLVICDLAYYWPQYTPITGAADYDIMLFTLSKVTGHAGSRVGWAIVKDKEVAEKMIKQIWLMSIGICHEGQLRATKILEHVANYYDCYSYKSTTKGLRALDEGLFEFGHRVLAQRWQRLRDVVKHGGIFSLTDFNPGYCNFMGKYNYPNPAFAWMETTSGEDAAELLMVKLKIRARSGVKFGSSVSPKYVRVNMLGSDHSFNLFLQRLSSLQLCSLN